MEDFDWIDNIQQPSPTYVGQGRVEDISLPEVKKKVKTVLKPEEKTCKRIDWKVKQEDYLAENFPDETVKETNSRTERVRKIILDKSLESLRQYQSAASTMGKNT